MDGYIMIHYCDYTDISWYCYFCGCLLAAQPVGDHFKGLVTYVNVLTFRHLPRACHLFWQGSGPVYVVIANMKLVALLCIGWHSKLPDPGHKDLAKLCKLRWSPFALPFWLDQPWYLWLSGSDYTEQINQGCRCSHVSDLLWAVAFFAMASLDGLLQHRETLWHETYDTSTSSACCFSVSFFWRKTPYMCHGQKMNYLSISKQSIHIIYVSNNIYIYIIYIMCIYILWFCMIMYVYINPLYT